MNAEVIKRFESQEKEFQKQERVISQLREWIAKHAELIAPFNWNVCVGGVHFFSHLDENKDPKAIARTFGKDGWTREKDSYTCGALHWVKEFDGVQLKIHEAEIVKLNPIEQVKL